MENTKINEWKEREVGCFWHRVSKQNKPYFSGKLKIPAEYAGKEINVVAYTNQSKLKSESNNRENFPDIIIYLDAKKVENPQKSLMPAAAAEKTNRGPKKVKQPTIDEPAPVDIPAEPSDL